MNRRRFLQLSAAGMSGLCASAGARKAESSAHVMTVQGPLAAKRLGRTLIHEHVLVDFIGADKISPGRYDPEEVFRTALPFLTKLKTAGGDTLVDCTPAFLGRDVTLLRRLAQASGLHTVINTGIYGAANDKYVPAFAYDESADQLASRWVREFEDGIPPDDIRPGFMKIGVDAGPLSAIDEKLIRAAARCHQRTGLAVASHTGDGVAAMAQLAVLEEERVSPSAFIWVHAQNEKDTALHEKAAKLGAWVEFDGITPETVVEHVGLVMRMKDAGHLRRVLISQDAGWYHVGESGGGNFRGYDFLFTSFLPALRRAGASSNDIHTLLVRNPQRALALAI